MNIIYLNKIILINLNSFNTFHQNKDLKDLLITFWPLSRSKTGGCFLRVHFKTTRLSFIIATYCVTLFLTRTHNESGRIPAYYR